MHEAIGIRVLEVHVDDFIIMGKLSQELGLPVRGRECQAGTLACCPQARPEYPGYFINVILAEENGQGQCSQ